MGSVVAVLMMIFHQEDTPEQALTWLLCALTVLQTIYMLMTGFLRWLLRF